MTALEGPTATETKTTMKLRLHLFRMACYLLLVSLSALSFACGGGGGGGGNGGVGPLVATFTGSNASPGANTISMAGTSAGANFSVQVRVTDLNQFFGTAFRVTYNPATVTFNGFSDTGTLLTGAATDIDAVQLSAGVIGVNATFQQQVEGVDVVGTELLLTLNFTATGAVAGNAFTFDTSATREVQTCPAPPNACTMVPDGNLTWSGGTLVASN